jgi:putative ABC transport system permease protein
MSLGVALVVMVIVIHNVISDSFNRSAQGYDLIIGPKGSALEIVLSTVFYRKSPVGTVPASYLEEFRRGKYRASVEHAIPVSIGHEYRGCPVVGTTPDFFTKLEFMGGKKYSFSKGGNFDFSDEHAAVVGARAFKTSGLQLGESFTPNETGDVSTAADGRHSPFKIVGVLEPTGTPNDNAIFVNVNGFQCMHDETVAAENSGLAGSITNNAVHEVHDHDHAHDHSPTKYSAIFVMTRREEAGRELSKEDLLEGTNQPSADLLNRTRPNLQAMQLPAELDQTLDVQAVSPSKEISDLLRNIVGNVQMLLILLAILVIIVAGIGMMVSIYNTMNERRQEIAVMRALGARRTTVMLIILLESILLSLGGGFFGVLIGHGLIGVVGPWISGYTGIAVQPWNFQWSEMILIPGLVILASVVGYLPAAVAYRQDVANSLKS